MNKVKFSSLNKAIFEQINMPDNAVIADLGCRDAAFLLGFQQAFSNKIKTAIGVDINDKGFENVKYKKPIKLKGKSRCHRFECSLPQSKSSISIAPSLRKPITLKRKLNSLTYEFVS